MSTITTDDVHRLAHLSSLQLSDEETDSLRADLENIVSYIEQLGQLDTTGLDPTYQVTGLENIFRDDKVSDNSVTRERLLELAQETENNSIKVPKVL
ncbi:Asp-tRNA(Asn)/Glu-tRNA(Gln) amidotransferase subunit GatC [Microbacteriaceae bacterium]|nr:Asp-tRNA(Asn)/Glu-tRNA(Gln) amidotransferase subunit GatC [Candidatus Saccharibacteria bacterium]